MKEASREAVRLYAGRSSVSVTEKYVQFSLGAYHDQITQAFD